MRAVIKLPGKKPYIFSVKNTLEALQWIVDGPIETVSFSSDLVFICNEEGAIRGDMKFNFRICNVQFFGPVVVVERAGDEFTDLSDSLLRTLKFIKAFETLELPEHLKGE